MEKRTDLLRKTFHLQPHVEGGSFAEVYTAPFEKEGRPLSGSIFFLLDGREISRFHVIDCDEIWYWHEGCGMKITMLTGNMKEELLLGMDTSRGECPMAVIPKGCVFAAENLDPEGYSFVSCVTTPQFQYDGFQLVKKEEIREKYPDLYDSIRTLAAD